jgi:hypothetical protein
MPTADFSSLSDLSGFYRFSPFSNFSRFSRSSNSNFTGLGAVTNSLGCGVMQKLNPSPELEPQSGARPL